MIEFSKALRLIISTLSGKRTQRLTDEKSLRFFQLKAWLMSDARSDDRTLHDAKVQFARMWLDDQIEIEMSDLMKNDSAAMPFHAMRELLDEEDDDVKAYFNMAFDSPHGLTRSVTSLPETDESRIRGSVNYHSLLCLRVQASGTKPIKDNAKKLYELGVDADPNCKLMRDIDPLLTRYRRRAAFMFVSAQAMPRGFLKVSSERKDLFANLRKNSTREKDFKRFFAQGASVQAVLQHGDEVSSDDILKWSGNVKPLAVRGVKPVSKEEFEAADDHYNNWQDRARHPRRTSGN